MGRIQTVLAAAVVAAAIVAGPGDAGRSPAPEVARSRPPSPEAPVRPLAPVEPYSYCGHVARVRPRFTSTPGAASIPAPAITGRVLTVTGTPVAGIEVWTRPAATPLDVRELEATTRAARTGPDGSFELVPALDVPQQVWVAPRAGPGRSASVEPGARGLTLEAGDALVTLRIMHPTGFPDEMPSVALDRRGLRHGPPGPTVHWTGSDDGGDVGRGVVVLRGVTDGAGATLLHVTSTKEGVLWRGSALLDQFVPPPMIRDASIEITLEREDD